MSNELGIGEAVGHEAAVRVSDEVHPPLKVMLPEDCVPLMCTSLPWLIFKVLFCSHPIAKIRQNPCFNVFFSKNARKPTLVNFQPSQVRSGNQVESLLIPLRKSHFHSPEMTKRPYPARK